MEEVIVYVKALNEDDLIFVFAFSALVSLEVGKFDRESLIESTARNQAKLRNLAYLGIIETKTIFSTKGAKI